MPSLGVAAALAGGRLPARGCRPRGRRDPSSRSPHPARAGQGDRRQGSVEAHDQQTMLINYRAPALVDGTRPYPVVRGVAICCSPQSQTAGGEKPDIDPDVFKDKIVFVGLDGLRPRRRVSDAVRQEARCPASSCTRALPTASCRIASSRRRRAWSAVAATVAGALLIGLMSAALPFWVAAGGASALVAGWTGASLFAFDRGLWLAMAQPHPRRRAVALFAGTAYRYFVEDAEKRKVSRLFGRYVSRDVYTQLMAQPGAGRARRRAARDVGPLLGPARFYQHHREGQSRGPRRAAERVLHAHGRDRLSKWWDGRQIRRRHGDGAVRRPAGRR